MNSRMHAISVFLVLNAVTTASWGQPIDQPIEDYSYKITLPGAVPAFGWQTNGQTDVEDDDGIGRSPSSRSEMLFKLSASRVEEPLELGASSVKWHGDVVRERIDFLRVGEARMQNLNRGFTYSAGVDVEEPAAYSGQSEFISSRQLGVHYGRLGSVNYSGVDLSFRQFQTDSDDASENTDDTELWSLGMTTGRRFALTGLDNNDPIWTLSLRGQFNIAEIRSDAITLDSQQWYFSPGLHWQRDSFRLSADVLMPFMQSGEYDDETDYSVRAKIQKRF